MVTFKHAPEERFCVFNPERNLTTTGIRELLRAINVTKYNDITNINECIYKLFFYL